MTCEPRWITKEGLLTLHDRSIALHGGAAGLRDEGLLEGALARPLNRFHYEGQTDIAALAACYAVSISSNHPFADGNKRAAYLGAGLFLLKNGFKLKVGQSDAALKILSLAAGKTNEGQLATWIAAYMVET